MCVGEALWGTGAPADVLVGHVTAILRTVKQTMVYRKLGSMARTDLQAVDRELRRCLVLS